MITAKAIYIPPFGSILIACLELHLVQGATFPVDITKTRLQLQGQADFVGTKCAAPRSLHLRPRMHLFSRAVSGSCRAGLASAAWR